MSTPRPKSATAPGRTEKQVPDVFCGIDPGLNGAIVFVDGLGMSRAWRVTPTLKDAKGKRRLDVRKMVEVLRLFPLTSVAIEDVNAIPMRGRVQGTTSMFNFGLGFGLWLGILDTMGIEHVRVPPKVWKKAILGGTAKDKAAAIEYVKRLNPTVDLRATPRSRVDHDGIADAFCLAEYARREWKTRQLLKGTHV